MPINSIILSDIGAVVGNIISIVAFCLIVTFMATFIAGAIASKQQKEIVRLKAELLTVEVYAADQNREKRRVQHELIEAYNEIIRLQLRVNGKSASHPKVIKDRILTPDMIMNLIKLCHPDKHGGSQIATEITQQLLDLKKKRK
jgi:hypothetical protein